MRTTSHDHIDATGDWGDPAWAEDGDAPDDRRLGRLTVWIAALVLLGSVSVAVQRTVLARADAAPAPVVALPRMEAAADAPGSSRGGPVSVAVVGAIAATTPATAVTATTSIAASTTLAGTTIAVSTPVPTPASVPTPAPTPPSTVTSTPSSTSNPRSTSTSTSSSSSASTLATLPDGTPQPAVATFDVNTVTLTGAVPDQPAKDRLAALAVANSKTQVVLQNMLTIDSRVPRTVGVRVIELTSSRFDEGSSAVHGAHAAELDRVTTIMNALPNVTVLVIGHADQLGSSSSNYRLSVDRATAVVDHLVASGVDPTRLSARAVGDSDLLSLNDDAASLALNRRTEFVFSGLFL